MNRKSLRTHSDFTASLNTWLRHHLDALRTAIGYLLQSPLTTLIMVVAMSVALALPSTLYLGMQNLAASNQGQGSPAINAFARVNLDNAAINRLAETINLRPDVKAIKIISQQQALEDLNKISDLKNILGTLEKNPLPATLVVTLRDAAASPETIAAIAQEIQNLDGIAETSVDAEWLRKIRTLSSSVRNMAVMFGIGLAILLGLMIHIALRSEILQRRDEIEVVKLVGGSGEFIERPFIYFAMIYGIFSTLLALVWLFLTFAYLQSHIDAVTVLYNSSLLLKIPLSFCVGLLLSVAIFTIITAIFTVRSLTYGIEPH